MQRHVGTLYVLAIVALGVGLFGATQAYKFNQTAITQENEFSIIEKQIAKADIKAPDTGGTGVSGLVSTGQTAKPQQSQDQILIAAVSKTAPAVVSIVISKAVPNLQIDYVNPFGDNSGMQDLGIRIPVYRQNGTSVQKIGAGSGFIVTRDGKILTNKHVVTDIEANYTVLLSTGAQKIAKVLYRDPNTDVAVLQIDGNYPTVAALGDSSALKLGQTVVAIGNALGEYSNSVSTGIVSGLNRTVQAQDVSGNTEDLSNIIQTDAAINLGNSGGPLIDLTGKVIGINVATVIGSSNINFAIPIDDVKAKVAQYL